MNERRTAEITRILREVDPEQPDAVDRLLPYVYDELRGLADRQLRGERRGHTLTPTALVHEVYIRLVGGTDVPWESRAHFFGVAARAMRQVLVSHARRRGAAKRGGGWERVTLGTGATPVGDQLESRDFELVDLSQALDKLAELDERAARVVELRFFGGLTLEETALVLGVSRRTAADDWAVARTWLARELIPEDGA